MSYYSIKIENLSKFYTLGTKKEKYQTLSSSLSNFVLSPYKNFKEIRSLGGQNQDANNIHWALKNIDLEIKQGEAIGIIGRNGAGKSTLLKILSRITEPSSGQIKVRGRLSSLLEVGTGFNPELTGRENIFLNGTMLGMTKQEIRSKFDEIVAFSGVEKFIDTPVKRYSSGMYVRLAFAVAAHLEPDILVVDEVLAVGDAEFQRKCIGAMNDVTKQGRTVLFVSHNMGVIKELCSKALLLENGEMVDFGDINQVTSKYLSQQQENKCFFEKDLEYIEAFQENDAIVLKARYNTQEFLDIPNLGFTLRDSNGTILFGSNPSMDKVILQFDKNQGEISVKITEPKLLDGDYFFSIWFGNSSANFVSKQDCLMLRIEGMNQNRKHNGNVGPIIPKCEWKIN